MVGEIVKLRFPTRLRSEERPNPDDSTAVMLKKLLLGRYGWMDEEIATYLLLQRAESTEELVQLSQAIASYFQKEQLLMQRRSLRIANAQTIATLASVAIAGLAFAGITYDDVWGLVWPGVIEILN
jgi:hypothetical protein